MNKVFLIGNVGKDAEVSQVGSTTVAKFSLATKETWKDKQGQKQEATEWHNVEVWGKQAEAIGKWIQSGRLLSVVGKITTQTWEKDGKKNYKTVIRAEEILFLSDGKKKEKESNSEEAPSRRERYTPEPESSIDYDDIPFS